MKKIKDSIRNKELLALVITIVLYFLIRVVLLFVGAKFSETREDELLHLKMDTLMETRKEPRRMRRSMQIRKPMST